MGNDVCRQRSRVNTRLACGAFCDDERDSRSFRFWSHGTIDSSGQADSGVVAGAGCSHGDVFFILIVGWDGAGYRRFFYAGNGEQWHQGQEFAVVDFFSSTIFYSLLGLGVILVPTYIWCARYLRSLSIKVN